MHAPMFNYTFITGFGTDNTHTPKLQWRHWKMEMSCCVNTGKQDQIVIVDKFIHLSIEW